MYETGRYKLIRSGRFYNFCTRTRGIGFLVNIISYHYFCTNVTERKEFSNVIFCQGQDISKFETRTSTTTGKTSTSN